MAHCLSHLLCPVQLFDIRRHFAGTYRDRLQTAADIAASGADVSTEAHFVADEPRPLFERLMDAVHHLLGF